MNPVLNIIGNAMGGIANNTTGQGFGQGVAQKSNPFAGIFSLYNSLNNSSDPMGAINSMAQFNPQIKQAVDIINKNGGDMQSAFYSLAKEKGVNPDDVLGMIRNAKL